MSQGSLSKFGRSSYNGFRDWRTTKLPEYKKDRSKDKQCYICGAYLRKDNTDGFCSCHREHIDIPETVLALIEDNPESLGSIASGYRKQLGFVDLEEGEELDDTSGSES